MQAKSFVLTTLQAARFLRVCPRTIAEWRKRRVIPFAQIGGVIRYRQADLEAVLEKFTVKAGGAK